MKRVAAFIGTGHTRYTYRAVRLFLEKRQTLGEVESEIVSLNDCRIGTCRGCQACLDRGEEQCPLRDDRDLFIEKIEAADSVVFAFPRPRFFGKSFTGIVCQGLYGGEKIVKYLDQVGVGLGFNGVKGSCLRTLHPLTPKAEGRIDVILSGQSRRFHESLMRPAYPAPTLLRLMLFRLSRSGMKGAQNAASRDCAFYAERGWCDSDCYYPIRLGVVESAAGRHFDSIEGMVARRWTAESGSAAGVQA